MGGLFVSFEALSQQVDGQELESRAPDPEDVAEYFAEALRGIILMRNPVSRGSPIQIGIFIGQPGFSRSPYRSAGVRLRGISKFAKALNVQIFSELFVIDAH
jgi:hypothetical protein